jgi:hypothetical protein
MSPNDSVWQGVLLGLGDDGTTYHCQGDTWQPYITPLNPQDKAAELTFVTEQRDGLRSGIDYASDQLHKVTEQRDRLAEALLELRNNESLSLGGAAYKIVEQALQYEMVEQSLQSLTTN